MGDPDCIVHFTKAFIVFPCPAPPPPPKVSPCSLVPSAYMFPCFSSIISLCSLVPPKVSPCSLVPHPKVSHVPLFLQLTCSLFPYKLFRFVPLVVPTLQNMPCSLETSGRASLLSYTRNVLCVGSVAIVNMGIWDHQIAIYLIGFSAFGILVILL